MTTAYVYRLYDGAGDLLYLGASTAPRRRAADHARKVWGHEVSRMTSDGPYERDEAFRREHEAIQSEQPRHNVASKDGRWAHEMARDAAAQMPPAVRQKAGPPLMIPIGEAARMLGVSVGTVRRWEREGKIAAQRTLGGQRRFLRDDITKIKAVA